MSSDPNNPYDEGGDVDSDFQLDPNRPPDPAWGDLFAGIWERVTNPLPRTT